VHVQPVPPSNGSTHPQLGPEAGQPVAPSQLAFEMLPLEIILQYCPAPVHMTAVFPEPHGKEVEAVEASEAVPASSSPPPEDELPVFGPTENWWEPGCSAAAVLPGARDDSDALGAVLTRPM
jgi:hypothetical protein